MSAEERNTITAIVSSLFVLAYYVIHLNGMAADGRLSGPDAVVNWARAVVWLIVAGIGFTIVVMILVVIATAIITGEKDPSDLVDERDRMIRGWGMRVTMVAASVGFLIGVGALALAWPVVTGLNIMFAAFALGGLAGDITKLALYRFGSL